MIAAIDDNTLLTGFQNGDSWAEKMVFDRFFEPLTLYSEWITRDLGAAEDIAVDAITKSIDRREHFEALTKLESFLYQVAHNASINHITASKRRERIHDRIRAENEAAGTEENDFRELEVLRAELLQEICREVENLPDQCGRIFKMIFLDQLSNEVIAERLGLNVQTIRSQKHRAIGVIRTALLKRGRLTTLLFFYAWLRLHS